MAKLDACNGEPVTRFALRLLLLTFVRTGELRASEWAEFDEHSAEWRIPAERMKMRDVHVVPLSRQALLVLKDLKPLTGAGRFVFPHWTNPARCMSENTILGALYRMGYHGRATGHGFRGTTSTILNEMGFAPDCIERQLAHAERNKVRGLQPRSVPSRAPTDDPALGRHPRSTRCRKASREVAPRGLTWDDRMRRRP